RILPINQTYSTVLRIAGVTRSACAEGEYNFSTKAAVGVKDGRATYWHLGMGISELEAGVLPAEAGAEKFPELLRHPPQLGGGELHFPAHGQREEPAELDWG